MNDARRRRCRYGDQFEHRPAGIGPNHEQTFLAVILVLHEPYRVPPRVENVGSGDAVLSGAELNSRRQPYLDARGPSISY